MMNFPLGFWDLSLWLAVTSIILLITTELISPYYGKTHLLVNRKKLRTTAIVTSAMFLITVAIRIYNITNTI